MKLKDILSVSKDKMAIKKDSRRTCEPCGMTATSELQIVRDDDGPVGPSTGEMMRPFSNPWAMP